MLISPQVAYFLIKNLLLLSSIYSEITSNFLPTDLHCHTGEREGGIDKKARNRLILASILCLFFMVLEIVGGIWANSLAIATDAAHLLTDFASFMISLFSIWVASR